MTWDGRDLRPSASSSSSFSIRHKLQSSDNYFIANIITMTVTIFPRCVVAVYAVCRHQLQLVRLNALFYK